MEIVEALKLDEKISLTSFSTADEMYRYAKKHVEKYRSKELETFWNQTLKVSESEITQEVFLKEFLWVVYVSGFRAATISAKYNDLLVAHKILDDSSKFIEVCKDTLIVDKDKVLTLFKNEMKFHAVQEVRVIIHDMGWDKFRLRYLSPVSSENLKGLPFMGPALSCHLARNLGDKNACKPDVHLVRIAKAYNLSSVKELCKYLDPQEYVGKTDLVLWLAAIDNGTL